MKKLFLYITLLTFLFITTFYISKSIFDNKMKDKQNTPDQLSVNETIPDENICVLEADSKSAAYLEHPENDITTENDLVHDIEDKYIVGIKNNYVIVYKNTEDCIFEYTGIDAEIIRCVNPDIYSLIKSKIVFDSKEDLFDFLESLAS